MKRTIYFTGIIVVGLILIIAAYYTFRFVIPTRLSEGDFETYRVEYGDVINTIKAQGIVEPENEVLLRSASGGVIKRILNVVVVIAVVVWLLSVFGVIGNISAIRIG